MVSLASLWLPILLSALIVFVVSSLIHMLLKYHNKDYTKLPSEDDVMESLKKFNIPPGDYIMPHAGSTEAMKSPEYKQKMNDGPVAFMTFMKPGSHNMGSNLVMWYIYLVIVSFFSAYLASRFLPADTSYITVFRFVSTTAFMGYSLALFQNSIWYKRNWGATFKSMFDGLIYGLLTGGTFGWLWPGM